MKNTDKVIRIGQVIEALPSLQFRIRLDEDDREILGYLGGKMRMFRIRILPGDRVKVEMSRPEDTKARIVYREK